MFEYGEDTFTLEDLQKAAKDQGLDFNTYLEQMKELGMKEVSDSASLEQPESNLGTEFYDVGKKSKTYGESWGDAIGRTGLNLFSGATDFVDATKRQMMDLYFDYERKKNNHNS